jgi:hypothetical protein
VRINRANVYHAGAYNTDNYYQEKDQGFGDVGVGQEPDAGTLDDRDDPTFEPGGEDLAAAEAAAAEPLSADDVAGAGDSGNGIH